MNVQGHELVESEGVIGGWCGVVFRSLGQQWLKGSISNIWLGCGDINNSLDANDVDLLVHNLNIQPNLPTMASPLSVSASPG